MFVYMCVCVYMLCISIYLYIAAKVKLAKGGLFISFIYYICIWLSKYVNWTDLVVRGGKKKKKILLSEIESTYHR